MRIQSFTVALGLSFGTVLLAAAPARAEDEEPRRVLLLDFEGAQSFGVRQWVDQRLRPMEGVEVVPKDEALDGASPTSGEAIVAVAERSELCAVVRGKTVGKGGKWTLTLDVIDGATGEPIDSVVFESTWVMGIKKELDATFTERFAPVVRRCNAPEEETEEAPEEAELDEPAGGEEPADDDQEPEREPRSKRDRSGAPRPTALQLELGLPLFTRRLHYEDDVTQTLRSYRLDGLAPGVAAGAVWYPGAHFTSGAAAHLGVTGGYLRGFPPAAAREGREFDTKTQSYRVGLRVRIPVDPVEIGILGEYGGHDYEVARDPNTGLALVPDVAYRFIRPGVVVALTSGAFTAEAAAGARIVLDTGELQSAEFFPDLTGWGFDAALGAGVVLGPVAVLLRGAVERYRFELRPSAVAPGPYGAAEVAIDRSALLGLVVRVELP